MPDPISTQQPQPRLPRIDWEALPQAPRTVDAKPGWTANDSQSLTHEFDTLNVHLRNYEAAKNTRFGTQFGVGNGNALADLVATDFEGNGEGKITITVDKDVYDIAIDSYTLPKLKAALGASGFASQTALTRARGDNLSDDKMAKDINDIFHEQLALQGFKPKVARTR